MTEFLNFHTFRPSYVHTLSEVLLTCTTISQIFSRLISFRTDFKSPLELTQRLR